MTGQQCESTLHSWTACSHMAKQWSISCCVTVPQCNHDHYLLTGPHLIITKWSLHPHLCESSCCDSLSWAPLSLCLSCPSAQEQLLWLSTPEGKAEDVGPDVVGAHGPLRGREGRGEAGSTHGREPCREQGAEKGLERWDLSAASPLNPCIPEAAQRLGLVSRGWPWASSIAGAAQAHRRPRLLRS